MKNDNKNKDKDTEKEKAMDEYIIPKRRVKMSDLPSYPLEYVEERKESDEITNLRMKTLEVLEQKEKEIKKSKVEVFKIKKEEAEKEKKIKKGNFTYDSEGNIVQKGVFKDGVFVENLKKKDTTSTQENSDKDKDAKLENVEEKKE